MFQRYNEQNTEILSTVVRIFYIITLEMLTTTLNILRSSYFTNLKVYYRSILMKLKVSTKLSIEYNMKSVFKKELK